MSSRNVVLTPISDVEPIVYSIAYRGLYVGRIETEVEGRSLDVFELIVDEPNVVNREFLLSLSAALEEKAKERGFSQLRIAYLPRHLEMFKMAGFTDLSSKGEFVAAKDVGGKTVHGEVNMTEGTARIYEGFLIVEEPPGTFKAYRNPALWASGIATYEHTGYIGVERAIDYASDEGDFDPARGLPAMFSSSPEVSEGASAHSPRVMEKVRQHLDLESWDTSRDAEINMMSNNEVLLHCLEWEGIIGYDYMIRYLVEDIYGVKLSK